MFQNTSMSGYQEVLTDPSYRGQIIVFTATHIGNVGTNAEDFESDRGQARGLVTREPITAASSHRSELEFGDWLEENDIAGIGRGRHPLAGAKAAAGGAVAAAIARLKPEQSLERAAAEAIAAAKNCPPMERREMAYAAGRNKISIWRERPWQQAEAAGGNTHIVAIDYGAKSNILRHLKGLGCRVTVCPPTATAEEIVAP